MVEEERSIINAINMRQKNWIGHLIRGGSLNTEILEERLGMGEERVRPRRKLLDWMMTEEYGKLKKIAQPQKDSEECHHWRPEPAFGQRT